MKSKFKIYGIYMIAYLLLLPALVTLGAIACINHLGSDGYFTSTTIANIGGIGVAAASIFFVTYIVWANKDIKFIPSFTSPLNYGPCAVMSAALIFISAHLAVKSGILTQTIDWFTLALSAIALLSVLYFLASAISVKRRSIMRSDFGIIVLIFLCMYVAYIFFDTGSPINAPIKTTTMMAFLFFSLFFLYETRLSLGREKWHYYVAFAFISSIISAYASIPNLIIYIIEGKVIGISIYETVLVFAFFIFSTFKLFLVGELVPEKGSNVVNKLIESARERINELQPEEPEGEAVEDLDENQFSILGADADENVSADTDTNEDISEDSDTEGIDENEISDAEAVENGFFENEATITEENIENIAEDGTRVTENTPRDTQTDEPIADGDASSDEPSEATDNTMPDENSEPKTETETTDNDDTRVTFSKEKDSIEE